LPRALQMPVGAPKVFFVIRPESGESARASLRTTSNPCALW